MFKIGYFLIFLGSVSISIGLGLEWWQTLLVAMGVLFISTGVVWNNK
jgi:hypothetical protein